MTAPDTSAEVERIRARALNLEHPLGIARTDVRTLLAALDRVTAERDLAAQSLGAYMARVDRVAAMVGLPNGSTPEQIAARLPSPESVTRARLVAAEIVETTIEARRVMAELGETERWLANTCAAHIRDRARTQDGTLDEGGDVDGDTLRRCAEDVDGCTTLGELEGLVRELREVRT